MLFISARRSRLRRFPFDPEVCAMNAASVAAALAERAEEVCRRYLPYGRRRGRYWVAGDLDGGRGRSLYVRLAPPGAPGKFTDAATGEHGDLLDIIRHRICAPTLRAALDEASRLPRPAGCAGLRARATPTTPPKRHAACGAAAAPSTAPTPRPTCTARGLARCRFPALRYHPAVALQRRRRRAPPAGPGRGRHLAPTEHRLRRAAHVVGSPATRPAKANVSSPAQGARARARPCRPFRRPRRRSFAPRRRGHRDRALAGQPPHPTSPPPPLSPPAASAPSLRLPASPASSSPRDNDDEGERAAERLARRCARAGVATTVIVPRGEDFNEDLLTFGPAALRRLDGGRARRPGARVKRASGRAAWRGERESSPRRHHATGRAQ